MRLRVCILALLLCACRPSDPKDPNTWLKRLSDSDPRARQQAVQELRKLKAREAAPQVAQLLKDVMVREEAATALRDIGGADEVPALLDAVDTTVGAGSDTATRSANRANARIAEALGEIGDPRAGPALLRLARSKDEYVRLEAVQALGEVKFKEAVLELSLLVDDPSAPPLLVKKAVVALGQIGDPAAIPALQHALVLERQGVSLLPEASYALFQLGPAAVAPLIRMAKDEDPAYLKWARENHRAAPHQPGPAVRGQRAGAPSRQGGRRADPRAGADPGPAGPRPGQLLLRGAGLDRRPGPGEGDGEARRVRRRAPAARRRAGRRAVRRRVPPQAVRRPGRPCAQGASRAVREGSRGAADRRGEGQGVRARRRPVRGTGGCARGGARLQGLRSVLAGQAEVHRAAAPGAGRVRAGPLGRGRRGAVPGAGRRGPGPARPGGGDPCARVAPRGARGPAPAQGRRREAVGPARRGAGAGAIREDQRRVAPSAGPHGPPVMRPDRLSRLAQAHRHSRLSRCRHREGASHRPPPRAGAAVPHRARPGGGRAHAPRPRRP